MTNLRLRKILIHTTIKIGIHIILTTGDDDSRPVYIYGNFNSGTSNSAFCSLFNDHDISTFADTVRMTAKQLKRSMNKSAKSLV